MRMLLTVRIPTEKGSAALKDGTVERAVRDISERLHPEAMYFLPLGGRRAMLVVFDMTDASQIVPVAEPLFTAVDAEVELTPIMNLDDLGKGLSAFLQAA